LLQNKPAYQKLILLVAQFSPKWDKIRRNLQITKKSFDAVLISIRVSSVITNICLN